MAVDLLVVAILLIPSILILAALGSPYHSFPFDARLDQLSALFVVCDDELDDVASGLALLLFEAIVGVVF